MKTQKKTAIASYIPAFITAAIGVATVIIYLLLIPAATVMTCLLIAAISVIPFIMTFVNNALKLGVPVPLLALIFLHFMWSVDVGTAMGVYKALPWWDLFVHGYFGLLASALLYCLFIRFEGKKPDVLHCFVIALMVVGLAGLWEIFEFTADAIFHNDIQNVQSALDAGKPALLDTMTDIMIAIVGSALFFAGDAIVRHKKK